MEQQEEGTSFDGQSTLSFAFDNNPDSEETPGAIASAKGRTIGNDMMAVALRIQERAQILQDETRRVGDTEPILLELRNNRDREQAINDKHRRQLLIAINERNSIELEIFAAKDAIENHKTNTEGIEKETLASEERIRELVASRVHQTKTVYGPNLARMETYIRVLETIVEAREKAVGAKRKRLEDLCAELENSKKREERIFRETKDIEEALEREQQIRAGSGDDGGGDTDGESTGNNPVAIGQEDEEISALSNRVRKAIEKRSALRKELKLAQRKFNEANEEMLLWEEKRIKKITSTKR